MFLAIFEIVFVPIQKMLRLKDCYYYKYRMLYYLYTYNIVIMPASIKRATKLFILYVQRSISDLSGDQVESLGSNIVAIS